LALLHCVCGFVAGRVSKKFEVLHGGIVGFIGILFGILFWTTLPLWYIIVSLVGVVPLGMIGGRIAEVSRNMMASTCASTATRQMRRVRRGVGLEN
jgi:hypothetical protein